MTVQPRRDADVLRDLSKLILGAGIHAKKVDQNWPAYELAFCRFEPDEVAEFDPSYIEQLCTQQHLLRNRSKLQSVVDNAKTLIRFSEVYGSFDVVIDALAFEWHQRRVAFMCSTFSQVGPTTAQKFLAAYGLTDPSAGVG